MSLWPGRFSFGASAARKLAYLVLILAPPAYILWAIHDCGVPAPFLDQWEFVPLLQKMHDHTLRFSDLWAQHNEHRIPFPKIVMLALAVPTGWNIRYEFATSFLVACLTFLLLYTLLRKAFPDHLPSWLPIAFSLIIFSPIQSENWLWGWQMQIFMAVFGAVAAVWAIERWPGAGKGLLVAIAAALLSSYSFSSGLCTWVIVVPLLLAPGRRRWSHVVIWALACAVTVGLYLHNYVKPAEHPRLSLFIENPVLFLEYVAIYLGSPLGCGSAYAALVGGTVWLIAAIVLPITLCRTNRGLAASMMPWLCLAWYALISACATGIGRFGLGVSQAMAPRYTTIASLLILAVLVMAAQWAAAHRAKQQPISISAFLIAGLLWLILCGAYIRTFAVGVQTMRQGKIFMNQGLAGLKDFPRTPDSLLLMLYPRLNTIRERSQALSKLGIIVPPLSPHDMADNYSRLGASALSEEHVGEGIAYLQKAVQLQPDWSEAANNLAWVLATSADPHCRNGAQAVELAERAYAADPKNFTYSDSLAAAYAEEGRFAQAIEASRKTIALAEAAGQTNSLPRFRRRLELYQSGQPFHEEPRPIERQ